MGDRIGMAGCDFGGFATYCISQIVLQHVLQVDHVG